MGTNSELLFNMSPFGFEATTGFFGGGGVAESPPPPAMGVPPRRMGLWVRRVGAAAEPARDGTAVCG